VTLSFLADESISPESAAYLETLGYPCHSLCREGPRRLSDREIVALAKREGRVILTHDLDFGQIYYFAEHGASHVWQAAVGIGGPVRFATSSMCVGIVVASFGSLVYTKSSLNCARR
jgi:hypothetical protein